MLLFVTNNVSRTFSMSPSFFFNDSATPGIYTYCHTLSLHDALPISAARARIIADGRGSESAVAGHGGGEDEDHGDQRQFEPDDALQAADLGRSGQEGGIGLQRLAPAQEAYGRPDRDQADQHAGADLGVAPRTVQVEVIAHDAVEHAQEPDHKQRPRGDRSAEHTSELPSLMRI